MHGRVKIRTTEEQKEIARREKQKKAIEFKNVMNQILEKRSSQTHDEEGLNLTGNLLTGNPDIITLWNYRREIFLSLKNDDDLESYQKLLEKDLQLTEQCLRVNPKSYGSWHHRIWILDNLPKPDWNKELNLCTKYLQLDERNFHCWDYRRIVAERSNVSHLSEYEFTMKKIESNFSNYSAWHLRSKLLPIIFPDENKKFPINEEKHNEELELVENAAFTDPNDQSAWFYLRWLLDLKEPKTSIIYAKCADEIYIITSKSLIMNSNDNNNYETKIKIKINDVDSNGVWINGNSQPQSCLWIFKPHKEIQPTDCIIISLSDNNNLVYESINLQPQGFYLSKLNFHSVLSESLIETITKQLDSCNQLIELEPDSKWTLLTRVFLMLTIDRLKYENEIKNTIDKLTVIDSLRKNYYLDLRSKIIVELELIKNNDYEKFNLSNQNLTCLYHTQYLHGFEEIDLSRNSLKSDCLKYFYNLLNCKCLNLKKNYIDNLDSLSVLPKLEILIVDDNLIENINFDTLKKFVKLKKLSLINNPIADKIDLIIDLSNYFVNVQFHCSNS